MADQDAPLIKILWAKKKKKTNPKEIKHQLNESTSIPNRSLNIFFISWV